MMHERQARIRFFASKEKMGLCDADFCSSFKLVLRISFWLFFGVFLTLRIEANSEKETSACVFRSQLRGKNSV